MDVKSHVTAEEWAARTDLAAAYRAVALFGWDDLVFTHISARVPGRGTISSSTRTACSSRRSRPPAS
jgi:ribulose-5-phosphate 4-epimerase/fuculose-1-phosphate aldolase